MLLHYCTIIQIFQIYFPSTYTRQLSYAALLVTSIWGFREVDFMNPHKQQHTSDHVHIYLVTDKENDIRDKEITQKVWPQSVVSLSLSVHQTSNCIEHAAPNIKYRHHMENKAQSGTNTLINTGIQKILYILVHFIACYITDTGIHYS